MKHDLKLIAQWLRANRISLNVDKIEIVIFQTEKKANNKKYKLSNKLLKDDRQNTDQISGPSIIRKPDMVSTYKHSEKN